MPNQTFRTEFSCEAAERGEIKTTLSSAGRKRKTRRLSSQPQQGCSKECVRWHSKQRQEPGRSLPERTGLNPAPWRTGRRAGSVVEAITKMPGRFAVARVGEGISRAFAKRTRNRYRPQKPFPPQRSIAFTGSTCTFRARHRRPLCGRPYRSSKFCHDR